MGMGYFHIDRNAEEELVQKVNGVSVNGTSH